MYSSFGFATEQVLSARQLQSATTINQLSAALLHSKLIESKTGVNNAMVSGPSLYYALSVLERGSSGATAQQLNTLLMTEQNAALTEVAPALAKIITSEKRQDRPNIAHFQLANSIWANSSQSFTFKKQYEDDASRFYNAANYAVNFNTDGAEKINNWADENTNGLIPEIIDVSTLKEFVWVIMNAAYFEGGWGTSMRALPLSDNNYRFTTIDGEKIATESIITTNYKAPVLDRADGSVAFKLPFLGNKYSFIVYMPSKTEQAIEGWLLNKGISDLPEVITAVADNKTAPYQLSIKLPKFAFSDGVEIREYSNLAETLGLLPLFSDSANFSLMSDRATKVQFIKQNTKIELDEKGVKAAAVTLIGGMIKHTAPSRIERRSIIVDRPFSFSIVENSSNTSLFSGVLTNPKLM